ncbi:SMP-30/gluconolactonase/LRE family protein [Metallosphaera tengchongensis]|uniref:SMP-30/gluconolactonase/LRE family protein n=1 Tax=Metallosphaera tengchongensis TaxID=1532350 RepID=A0A6N0NUA8_9CREN|nr:SMP-30/gluconolactonase/LRE family protein [Metallosphaera tengchongensis]QKQ99057.1 SMP-30/gluconolactonase/LRE family protein [Metallosphaera tengchongensis]
MNPKILLRTRASLGEGPVWDPKMERLLWVDIEGGKLHITTNVEGEVSDQVLVAPEMVSSIGLTESSFLVSARQSLYRYDGSFKELGSIKDVPQVRFNDGKCGPDGNFWVGTMDLGEKDEIGKLYVFNGRFKVIVDKLIISNGLDWFRDVFYLVDSPKKRVYAFRVKGEELESLGVAVETWDYPGVPDGMTVDLSGNLWIAHYGGGIITKWEPFSRKPILEVKMPVKIVTSLTFGGKDLDKIFVTSSSRAGEELGGSLFVLETDEKGREPHLCKEWI